MLFDEKIFIIRWIRRKCFSVGFKSCYELRVVIWWMLVLNN